jgi:hypothetical protein
MIARSQVFPIHGDSWKNFFANWYQTEAEFWLELLSLRGVKPQRAQRLKCKPGLIVCALCASKRSLQKAEAVRAK